MEPGPTTTLLLGLITLGVSALGLTACSDDTTSTPPPVDTTTTTRVSGSGAGSGERMAANLAACFGANRPDGWTILDDDNVSVPANTITDVATRSGFVNATSKDQGVTTTFLVNFEKNCRITSAPGGDGSDHVQVFRDADAHAAAPSAL